MAAVMARLAAMAVAVGREGEVGQVVARMDREVAQMVEATGAAMQEGREEAREEACEEAGDHVVVARMAQGEREAESVVAASAEVAK